MTTARYYYVGQQFRQPAHLRRGHLVPDAVHITTLRHARVPAGACAVLAEIGYCHAHTPARTYYRTPEQFEALIEGWDQPAAPAGVPQ